MVKKSEAEEKNKLLMAERAKFVEKAKQIALEPEPEDKPAKRSSGKVICCLW